jgi:hypothetical protein
MLAVSLHKLGALIVADDAVWILHKFGKALPKPGLADESCP